LPGRGTIVLTRQLSWSGDGVITASDLDDAIAKAAAWINDDASREKEIIIFGGGEIYSAFLPRTDRIDLTEIDLSPDGDATFPALNPNQWQEVGREDHPAQDGVPAHAFVQLERVTP